MPGFERLILQLERTGHRRLVVLSGDEQWTLSQASRLRETLPGDWPWLSEAPSKAIGGLLGREYRHAVFDARAGFDVSAFAALSGTLRAGSLLVLLVPPLSDWADRPDSDSVRWSDSAEPIPTPRFVHHFCRTLAADSDAIVWQQHCPRLFPLRRIHPPGSPPAVSRSASRLRSSTRFWPCQRAWLPLRPRAGAESQRWQACCSTAFAAMR